MDEVFVVGHADVRPSDGTHDPKRHRLVEPQRVADGEDEIAHAQLTGIAPRHRRQAEGGNLHNGYVRFRIGRHHLAFILTAVGQEHVDFHRVGDHVVVGDDQSVRPDDHAGALPILTTRWQIRHQPELERLVP